MKKWISLMFIAAVMLFVNVEWTSAAASKAAPAPKLYLDGTLLKASVPPVLVNGSVLVPIRTVAENMGYKVGYNGKNKQITVKNGSTVILMTLNKSKATVNGKSVTMPSSPMLKSGSTMVPLRFVGESFGLQALWDPGNKSVFLSSEPPAGTGGGTGTDVGAVQPDPNPADGGLIGVVDGNDGAGNTDGTSGTGSGGGTQDGTGGTGNPGQPGGDVPQAVPTAQAHLHQIRYEPDTVVISYDGLVAPASQVITGPDRIVIDLPNADFAEDFYAGSVTDTTQDLTSLIIGIPAPGEVREYPVTGQDALFKIRYSQYQNTPKIARVVLDLNSPQGFEIRNDAMTGELRILLKEAAVPVKSKYTVVLDAGHGGSDPGAPSVIGRWEKEFNMIMVKKVQAILSKESKINLVLTRSGDSYPSLDDRVNLANSLKADLFLSIHGNSWKAGVNGTETYYTRAASLAFAKLLHKNAVAATGFKDGGVRNAGFKVIKYTKMPAVLLEVGYLSYAPNANAMFNDAFENRVAAAIAASIIQYLK